MEKLLSKDSINNLTILGLYQVIGGALGLVIILIGVFDSPPNQAVAVLLYLFILLFFAYSILCGILCLKLKKSALVHSLTNQILQLLAFAMMGFAFKYVAGLYLSIGLDLSESIKLTFGAGVSKFEINFNREADRLELDINLVALALIFWIDKLMKKIREEVALRQAATIGDGAIDTKM